MITIDENVCIVRENKSYYKCASDTYFTLHDFQGRCLITMAPSDSEQLIDLSEIPAGEYIMTVSGKNEVQTHKMVIRNKP